MIQSYRAKKQAARQAVSMPNSLKLTPDETIACEICLKEVPVSDAKNEEVSYYIIHFYRLECYAV